VTRSRERSFTAGSSPSSIARRTAFSDSWQATATSRIDNRCQLGSLGASATLGPGARVQVIRDVLVIAQ
jgi:hypothetical protein